jgi:hypothetical protein
MKVEFSEQAVVNPGCEFRLGFASWDKGKQTERSVKFAWLDKNGRVARGGEFPVEALPQALDFAIRKGYISLCSVPKTRKK